MDWFVLFVVACGAILIMAGVVGVKNRIFVADCVGRGGFVIGAIGVLLKFFSGNGHEMVRLPDVTLWMLVILILSSTAIMMLSKIHEVLLEIRDK